MRTRQALGQFLGQEIGDTFLSDPKIVSHFKGMSDRKNAAIDSRIRDLQTSSPHVLVMKKLAESAFSELLIDPKTPLIDKYSAYKIAEHAHQKEKTDRGLRVLAVSLKRGWEADPTGTYTLEQVQAFQKQWGKNFGDRTSALSVLTVGFARAGYAQLPIRELTKIAREIQSQFTRSEEHTSELPSQSHLA